MSTTTLTNPQLLLLNTLNIAYNDNRASMDQLLTAVRASQNQTTQLLEAVTRLQESNDAIMANVTRLITHAPLPNVPRTSTTTDVLFAFLNNVRAITSSINNAPEVRRATPEDIERATRTVLFRDVVRPLNTQCPITMSDFQDNDQVTVIRHCGHLFHANMLRMWFERNHCCPVCRHNILQEEEAFDVD